MKKAILFVLVLLLLASPVLAVLPAETDDHVIDTAGALSAGVRHDVNALGALMLEEIGAEIMVVAVEYITIGQDSEQMAFSLMDQWQVSPRGMLLLFSTQERRGGLVVGEEIITHWPASRIETYLNNYFWTDLDAGRYDAAVISMVTALTLWYEDFYNVLLISDAHQPVQTTPGGELAGLMTALAPLFLIVIVVIVLLGVFGRRAQRRQQQQQQGPLGGPMGQGPMGTPMMPRRRGLGPFGWMFLGSQLGRRGRGGMWGHGGMHNNPRNPRSGPGAGPGNSGFGSGGFNGRPGGGRPGGGGGFRGGGGRGGGFGGRR